MLRRCVIALRVLARPAQPQFGKDGFAPLPPPQRGFRVYCDLDGVLADFERGARAVGVEDITKNPAESWKKLAAHDDFFGTLEWMAEGGRLWAAIAAHRPMILTGLPRGSWAEPQKRRWVAKNLGTATTVITCMRRSKVQLAAPGCVLIDDDARTCEDWAKAGGHAVHHTCVDTSITQLEEYISEKKYLSYRTGQKQRAATAGLNL